MRLRIGLALLALLPTACGGVLYGTTSAMTSRAPQEVFDCTEAQFRVLGYRRVAHDRTDLRLVGERTDTSIKVSSGLFRRGYHRMEVMIRPDASGSTAMEVKVQTFKEFETQAGQVSEEAKAYPSARLDAQKLVQSCGSSS